MSTDRRQPSRAEVLGILRAVCRKVGPVHLTTADVHDAIRGDVFVTSEPPGPHLMVTVSWEPEYPVSDDPQLSDAHDRRVLLEGVRAAVEHWRIDTATDAETEALADSTLARRPF